ncbi:MAG: hypothetical protein JW730_12015 [Anaerolineales bacterium]|nr:hypothetical protein [Anaerolineales bacterium]
MTVKNSVQHLQQMSDPLQATTETMAYITKMTYQDWKALIEGPALARNLAMVGFKETTAITDRLMQTLVEQQSLFTMAAH